MQEAKPDTTASTLGIDRLLTRDEAAKILGIAPMTMRCWVTRRYGPPIIKVGHLARYRVGDLRQWIEEQKQPTAATA